MQKLDAFDVFMWLGQMDALVRNGKRPVNIFMKPFHFATLAQVLRSHPSLRSHLLTETRTYLSRMRLWEAIEEPRPRFALQGQGRRDSGGSYVPLTKLNAPFDAGLHASLLTELVRTQGLGCSSSTYDSIFTAWVELIGNCYAHANAPGVTAGLACAQAWTNGNLAQLAIIDPGIGVRASLAESDALRVALLSENACDLATRLGVSSKLGKGHAGYGLAFTRQLAEAHNGTFMLLSGSEGILSADGKVELWSKVRNPIGGTLVVFEWRLDQQLDAMNVYSKWPADEADNDDFF